MADAQTATMDTTAPAPPSLDDMLKPDPAKLQKGMDEYRSAITEHSKAEAGIEGTFDKRAAKRESEMEKARAAESHEIGDLKPWNADEEMRKYSHSPMEEFGSLATIFSIAASAFTHTPATNAMNAAAAYMNAVNSGDAAGYQKAFTAFKENSQLALDRARIEHEQF